MGHDAVSMANRIWSSAFLPLKMTRNSLSRNVSIQSFVHAVSYPIRRAYSGRNNRETLWKGLVCAFRKALSWNFDTGYGGKPRVVSASVDIWNNNDIPDRVRSYHDGLWMVGCLLLHSLGLGWLEWSVHIPEQAVELITATISVSEPEFCGTLSEIRRIVEYMHTKSKIRKCSEKFQISFEK
jgi:hypothetical protein